MCVQSLETSRNTLSGAREDKKTSQTAERRQQENLLLFSQQYHIGNIFLTLSERKIVIVGYFPKFPDKKVLETAR